MDKNYHGMHIEGGLVFYDAETVKLPGGQCLRGAVEQISKQRTQIDDKEKYIRIRFDLEGNR